MARSVVVLYALVEVTEHVVAGGLRGDFVRLVLRVHVEAVAKEVQVEVAQVCLALFRVPAGLQLLLVQALKVVHRGDKVQVDLRKDIAIAVLLDILKGKLFHYRLLAVKVADARL